MDKNICNTNVNPYNINEIISNPKSLKKVVNLNNQFENEILFAFLCGKDLIDEAKYLLEFDERLKITANSNCAFKLSCKNNRTDTVIWLIELALLYNTPININIDDNYGFRKACRNGNLLLAKYFYINHGVNITLKDNYAFRKACEFGHLNIFEWLLKINDDYSYKNKIKIRDKNNYGFKYSCRNGHLEIVKNLFKLDKKVYFSKRYDKGQYIRLACENGHLQIAQYLYEIDPTINISEKIHYCFRLACINNHQYVATWLMSFYPSYKFFTENGKITNFVYK